MTNDNDLTIPNTSDFPTEITIPSSLSTTKRVPNHFPSITNQPYRIAIIGEAPGKDEEYSGFPFVGMSGRLLTSLLSKAAIIRDACFIGNICQLRPPDNNIKLFNRAGEEIKDGLGRLETDLRSFKPNVVLLLGKTALWAAKGVENITDWRGSFFVSDVPGPFYGLKCLASFHPAACLRQYDYTPLLMMDIIKVKKESTFPQWSPPVRSLTIDVTADYIVDRLNTINLRSLRISPDIEGYVFAMSCCSIAVSGTDSFIIPFRNLDGSSYWSSEDDELRIWSALARTMANPSVHKIWQNGLYDRFVKTYGHGLDVLGNEDDNMLLFWEMYCELEKGLGNQCSILTREPFYKFERKINDRSTHYRYCCRDSAVTFEINDVLKRIVPPSSLSHYYFNRDLLNPLLYMELRGILYDTPLAKTRLIEVDSSIYNLQYQLDRLTGYGAFRDGDPDSKENRQALLSLVRETMCWKNDQGKPKKEYEDSGAYDWCVKTVLSDERLDEARLGRLSVELGKELNTKGKALKDYLYTTLDLPVQYIKDPKTGIKRPSTNYESLLKLQKSNPCRQTELTIEIGLLRTRSQMLHIHADPDGRIRCGYNVVGTETGRLSCYTSPTGSGYNLQTIPDINTLRSTNDPLRTGMRDLFVADPGYFLFQCDLKGSDGWTIGAYLKMLGDPTMFDDLSYGLKPAAICCYIFRHGPESIKGKNRAELKEMLKEVKKDDWDYFAFKIGIWGLCYLMGPDLLASVVAIQSEGRIWLSRSQVESFRLAVFARYRVKVWHDWMARELTKNNNVLTAPNGFRRKFFGRGQEILGQALAHMPQVITTWATNSAMYRLWHDRENRSYLDKEETSCALKVEPLHQVHDALLGQFPTTSVDWSTSKLRTWFNNPVTVAGITLVIPFEGNYGTDWAMSEQSKKGTI